MDYAKIPVASNFFTDENYKQEKLNTEEPVPPTATFRVKDERAAGKSSTTKESTKRKSGKSQKKRRSTS